MQDCKCHNCGNFSPVPNGEYQGLCKDCKSTYRYEVIFKVTEGIVQEVRVTNCFTKIDRAVVKQTTSPFHKWQAIIYYPNGMAWKKFSFKDHAKALAWAAKHIFVNPYSDSIT